MDNQHLSHLSNLTKEEIQILLSAFLGDGHYQKQSLNGDYGIMLSSINKELLSFKKSFLTNLQSSDIVQRDNSAGYNKNGVIYCWRIFSDNLITHFYHLSLEHKLRLLSELGIALWVYDDGSLHKTKLFYNICTHSFPLEEQLLMKDAFNTFNIFPSIAKEVKKDGRMFYYLRINKYSGSVDIAKILQRHKVTGLNYKCWSSETIQKWSTLQEEWKSGNLKKTFKQFSRGKI